MSKVRNIGWIAADHPHTHNSKRPMPATHSTDAATQPSSPPAQPPHLKPQRSTISRAMWLAASMSAAPAVLTCASPSTSRSAHRPAMATTWGVGGGGGGGGRLQVWPAPNGQCDAALRSRHPAGSLERPSQPPSPATHHLCLHVPLGDDAALKRLLLHPGGQGQGQGRAESA